MADFEDLDWLDHDTSGSASGASASAAGSVSLDVTNARGCRMNGLNSRRDFRLDCESVLSTLQETYSFGSKRDNLILLVDARESMLVANKNSEVCRIPRIRPSFVRHWGKHVGFHASRTAQVERTACAHLDCRPISSP
jgi:hypothetical protein